VTHREQLLLKWAHGFLCHTDTSLRAAWAAVWLKYVQENRCVGDIGLAARKAFEEAQGGR
jgi:hypothetical protein